MSSAHQDRTYLVTGAASGIGRATATLLAEHGAHVVVADVDGDAAATLATSLNARALACDVRDPGQVARAVQAALDWTGRLDGAFNNAGVLGPLSPLHEVDHETWHRVRAVNLDGVWNGLQAQVPVMLDQGDGTIVNCSSVAGLSGFQGAAGYAATKHAILGLTRSAALDYAAQGLRINAVCPGPVRTPLLEEPAADHEPLLRAIIEAQPNRRLLEPEEVAETVAFLLSPAASGINGEAVVVDGGLHNA